MNKIKVQESKIHGLGLFADQEFNEGDMIGLAHYNGVPSEIIGKFHNHSDNPNAHSVTIGNKRFLVALNPLRKGEEITVDYREQPELEQPEEFAKGGLVNMPKPSKKGLASKRYSRDLTATNRLLTKNKLLQKPKSKKRRIYDPNAKYYQDGGTSNSKNNFYTVQGSDGVYRKAGSNWEVDWNRSGNFQPLSKGDVAKRTAVLNSQAKPLYDPIYDDTYATRQSAYTAPVKPTPAKKPTAQDKAAQEQFDKNFQVTGKSKMEVVEDKILQDQQNYIQHAKEKGYEATQEELDQLEERGWVQYGNVGASPNPYSMKQAGPAEKPQEFWDKAGDIISNPMTSAGFLMRGQEIPDYMQRNMDRGTFGYYSNGVFHTERNPLDFAVADMTGLGLVNDARQTYQGIANKDVAQAGLGALGFIPGMTELKNVGKAVNAVDAAKSANKAIEFAGPMKHSYQDVPEALNALRQRGAYWDKTGATGKDLLHPDMINYHGTYAGRPLVEVKMPDGSSEMFYKSSGWAGKQGAGANGTTEGMWQIFGGHADTPKTSNWFIKDQDYQNYYGSKTFGNMAENMDNALMQKLNFKSVDELDNAFNFQNRFGDVDSYTPKKQMGGTVELDGYRFKKDASGNWTYESGAPVTDRGMIQRLTYEAKPVESPVVQSRPKPSLDKPVNNYTTINKLKNSPVLADQEKVKQAESLALEELVYNPVVPNIRSKEDFPNDVEGLIDEALNFPEARARIAAKAAVDPGEDPSDPFRHSNAARYTAESIKDYVADVPYQSIPFIGDAVNEYMDNYVAPGLGFLGANLLGLAHEASIFVRDTRPVDIKYRESFEDMYNNYVGAKTGASDMSPEAKTNYLLYLNRTNRLPDGVVPKPGSNKNLYIKSGPNDPGKFKSSYEDGGELDTYPIGGGPGKGKRNKEPKKVEPFVTSDPAEYAYRKGMYDDSLSLYNAYQFQKKNINAIPKVKEYVRDYNQTSKKYPGIRRPGQPSTITVNDLLKQRNINFNKKLPKFTHADYLDVKKNPSGIFDTMHAPSGDYKIYDYYKKLKFNNPVAIGKYSSPDIFHSKINPSGSYFDGIAYSPTYKRPVQEVIFNPEEQVQQYPTEYKPEVNQIPPGISKGDIEKGKVVVGDKVITGYEEQQQLDPKTGKVTTVINPVYEDLEKPIPTLHPTRVNPELQKFVYPETELEETEEVVEEDVTPEEQIYVDEEGNYVDEEGNYIDMGRKGILPDLYIDTHKYKFSTPKYRLRRPGHGGDLIKRVGTNYHYLPGIERGLSSHSYMDYEQD